MLRRIAWELFPELRVRTGNGFNDNIDVSDHLIFSEFVKEMDEFRNREQVRYWGEAHVRSLRLRSETLPVWDVPACIVGLFHLIKLVLCQGCRDIPSDIHMLLTLHWLRTECSTDQDSHTGWK